jgi:hypothetical protein
MFVRQWIERQDTAFFDYLEEGEGEVAGDAEYCPGTVILQRREQDTPEPHDG